MEIYEFVNTQLLIYEGQVLGLGKNDNWDEEYGEYEL